LIPPPEQSHPIVREPVTGLPHNVILTLEGPLFGSMLTDFSVTIGGTTEDRRCKFPHKG
jgi:hypothetical protein